MTPNEMMTLLAGQRGTLPVKCKDGRMGLLIRFAGAEAGVQVPGEEEIRSVRVVDLHLVGDGALEER